jgi:autotransporter-associated beta strand protein
LVNQTSNSTYSGVIAGDGSFTLGSLSSAILTLSGANTYTGVTKVDAGALKLSSTGSLSNATGVSIAAGATFDLTDKTAASATYSWNMAALSTSGAAAPAAITGTAAGTIDMEAKPISLTTDATNPSLTVTGATLALGGNAFNVVVPGPALTAGVYTLVSAPSITGTVNPTATFTGGNGLAGGTTGVVSISGNNVVLTVTSSGGDPYGTWATGGEVFTDDANNDGVENGLAWILGASGPNASALDNLPQVSTPDGFLQLEFTRENPYSPAKFFLEYGDDLTGWTKLEIPATTSTIGGDIEVTVTAGPPDTIQIKIPDTHAVNGKLFARLSANEN